MGGAGGVSTELGEDPPVLQVGKDAFDGDASGGKCPVGILLAGGQLAGAGGLESGDDYGVVRIVVQAEEAQVGQGAEAGGAQVGQQVVAAGGGDVVGVAGPGSGYPDQPASLVGQGEDVQAVTVVLDGVVRPVRLPGAALGWG